MTDLSENQYARTADGAHIAFKVVGDGPLDLLFVEVSANVDLVWETPAYAHVFGRLASFGRLIQFDPRGSGLSDPLSLSEQPTLEERTKDLLAVLDAAGSQQTALVANGSAGLMAIFFAAAYPNRTSSLVLDGCYARLARAPDYPIGVPRDVLDNAVARVAGGAGPVAEAGLRYFAPKAMENEEFAKQYRRYNSSLSGPSAQRALAQMLVSADVRPALSAIQVPTLVLYRSGDRWVGRPHANYLAEHISGAKLVELPGEDNLIFAGDPDIALGEIEEFLTGARHAPPTNRVLATVLFTDIVGSTERAAELGDARWRELLETHDGVVRRQLERFRGNEVNTVGDGFLATFDGPGRAIECACAIRDAVSALGLKVRIGLHTGEIEAREGDIAGLAVHIGARVGALAAPGEVLASGTVKDLVVGSGIEFEDRGEHELKGVPGTWRVYAVRD